MNILVIRHGQSEADILNVIEGRADFDLTELGRRQANLVGKWVKENYRIDRIYASTLKRAKHTAEYISKYTKIPITLEDNLMEYQNGLIAGLTREEAAKKYPEPKHIYPHTKNYNMESNIEFRSRAETVLSQILHENDINSTVVIVSHGGMINQLYRSFLRLPVDTDVVFGTGDTGVHLWKFDDRKRAVVFSNKQEHLL